MKFVFHVALCLSVTVVLANVIPEEDKVTTDIEENQVLPDETDTTENSNKQKLKDRQLGKTIFGKPSENEQLGERQTKTDDLVKKRPFFLLRDGRKKVRPDQRKELRDGDESKTDESSSSSEESTSKDRKGKRKQRGGKKGSRSAEDGLTDSEDSTDIRRRSTGKGRGKGKQRNGSKLDKGKGKSGESEMSKSSSQRRRRCINKGRFGKKGKLEGRGRDRILRKEIANENGLNTTSGEMNITAMELDILVEQKLNVTRNMVEEIGKVTVGEGEQMVEGDVNVEDGSERDVDSEEEISESSESSEEGCEELEDEVLDGVKGE